MDITTQQKIFGNEMLHRYLRENSPVVITGRLSIRDEKEPQIVINRARPISDYSEAPPVARNATPERTVPAMGTLYLRLESEADPRYRKTKAILNMFPGETTAVLFFANDRSRRGTKTTLDSRMLEELERVLGKENVVVK